MDEIIHIDGKCDVEIPQGAHYIIIDNTLYWSWSEIHEIELEGEDANA